MTYDARDVARVRNPVLLIAGMAWILLLVEPAMGTPHCATALSMTTSWALMLIAMMSPVLIPPLCHIRLRSFRRRRARSTVLFVIGYGGIWMLFGLAMLVLPQQTLRLLPRQSYVPAAGVAL